jgi:hypothetical protein
MPTPSKFPYVIVKPRPAKATLTSSIDQECALRLIDHVQVLTYLSPASVHYLEGLAAELCERAEMQWRIGHRASSL